MKIQTLDSGFDVLASPENSWWYYLEMLDMREIIGVIFVRRNMREAGDLSKSFA